jgi:hypothetical protein
MDSAQMLSNLTKLAVWDGSNLTPEFVEAQASNPMFVKLLWEMDETQDNWKSYQEQEGFKEQALKEVEEQLGVYETLDDLKWSVKGPAGPLTAERKELKEKYSQVPPQLAVELYEEHKAKLIAEAEAKLKPAPVKKAGGGGGGGTKSKFVGDDYVGDEKLEYESEAFNKAIEVAGAKAVEDDTAKFKFVGDEKCFVPKSTLNKDKSKRTWRCLPVSSNRDLGMRGIPSDKFCNGSVIWDKASSSQALKDKGMSASAFRIRCGKAKVEGKQFCAGCESNGIDFFKTKYTITKGTGTKWSGTTYKHFMVKQLVFAEVGGVE